MVSLFGEVVLKINFGKTVDMVCLPCQLAGTHSEAEYRRRVMGDSPVYRDRQRVRVQCMEYREEMALW